MSDTVKVQEWIRRTFPNNKRQPSKVEIDNLLRGPMKDILLNFLLPQARSSAEIEVIRDNLYVHGLSAEPSFKGIDGKKKRAKENELSELKGKKKELLEKLMRKSEEIDKEQEHAKRRTAKLRNLQLASALGKEALSKVFELYTEGGNDEEEGIKDKGSSSPSSLHLLRDVHTHAINLFKKEFINAPTEDDVEIQKSEYELEKKCEHLLKGGGTLTEKGFQSWQSASIQKEREALEGLGGASNNCSNHAMQELKQKKLELCKEHVDTYIAVEEMEDEINQVLEDVKQKKMTLLELINGHGHGPGSQMRFSYELKRMRERELKAHLERRKLFVLQAEKELKDEDSKSDTIMEVDLPLESEVMEKLLCSVLRAYPLTLSGESGLEACLEEYSYDGFIKCLKSGIGRV